MRNLNSCPNKEFGKYLSFLLLFGGLLAVCFSSGARALDPQKSISQYNREFWGTEKGFSYGTVYAFAQTPDGYLWIGTEKGLVRFDGVKFEFVQPENTLLQFAEPVLGLATDAEGSLWVRLRSPKVIRYKNGKFEDALLNLSEVDPRISSMSRNASGELLFTTLENGPLKYTENKFNRLVPKSDLPSSFLISVTETAAGEVWMGTRESGLYRFDGSQTSEITVNLPDRKINCLLADNEKSVWVGTDRGLAYWNGAALESPVLPERLMKSQILTLVKDRQDNLWIGTKADGIVRLDNRRQVSDERIEGDSDRIITALFEDREGNLWVGSQLGVERLRDNSFVTYSVLNGLPTDANGPVFTDAERRTWFAPLTGGLFWLKDSKSEKLNAAGLADDIVYSIDGAGNDLWIGRRRGGLTHLSFDENRPPPVAKTYTQADGLAQNSVYTVFLASDGAVWAGTLSGGVSRFKDGKFINYTASDGLPANTVNQIAESRDGSLWFATPGGLSAFSGNAWRSFTKKDGLPADAVNCLAASAATGGLWLGTDNGLAFYDGAKIRGFVDSTVLPPEPVLGLVVDKNGYLWISSVNHVLQVDERKLASGAIDERDVREFGTADGLLSREGVRRSRSVTIDAAGKIWFSLNRGLSMVSPTRIDENSAPALLRINYLTADGERLELANPVQVSAVRQRIIIGFTGISLEVPERVRYRYKLENFDKSWSEPTAAREAVYTNLSPGIYRFHVIASNSRGAWNGEEAVVEFEIVPMFWQTWWFRFAMLMLCLLLIFIIFRIREYRLARSLTLRFEERLAERTLLARDLHDSLLQGVVGASIQLNVAIDQAPENSPSNKAMSKVLMSLNRVIEEGRNTIRGLRAVPEIDSEAATDLEQSLAKMWRDFSAGGGVDFRVILNGESRALHPLVNNEVQRIGGEALINAIKHSAAKKIEIEIDYAAKHFKMSVRDDGCGIDPDVLKHAREGHWGLLGMRERADRIRAKLRILSRIDSGTEIEIVVPALIAYERQPSNNKLLSRLLRFYERKTKSEVGQ